MLQVAFPAGTIWSELWSLMYRRSLGPAARLASDTAGLRVILGCRCGALNDRASSCWRWQDALEQHAREDQPEGHGHDDQKGRGAARDNARQQSRRLSPRRDQSARSFTFAINGTVNCVVRSSSQCIAHFPRGRSIFRDPRFRKACPCRKRICREPSPTHETEPDFATYPLNFTRLGCVTYPSETLTVKL